VAVSIAGNYLGGVSPNAVWAFCEAVNTGVVLREPLLHRCLRRVSGGIDKMTT
jgi:hypothetical protein